MTQKEYLDLFHKAQVNLVAFKPVFHCDDELRRMVEMAVEAERQRFMDELMKNPAICRQIIDAGMMASDPAGLKKRGEA